MLRWFILLCLFQLVSSQQCPPGGVYNAMYKKCYEFYQEPAQFAYAEQQCNGEHGHLVSIASAFENSLVNVNAEVSFPNGTKNYWIGINDLLKPGTWTWISGSNATYDDWAPTQPRQGSDCGMVQISEGQWYSADCMTFLPYVCEVPVIYPPTCPPQSTPPPITCPTYAPCTENYCFPQCDAQWTYFWETGYCYKTFFEAKWDDAESNCLSYHAHLASIHSEAENTFVNYIARTGEKQDPKERLTWIGLQWSSSLNQFVWSDNTTFDYSNWSPGEPTDLSPDACVETASDRTHHEIIFEHEWYESWNNVKCLTVMRSYVCKKKPYL